jgi:hypothetical protein
MSALASALAPVQQQYLVQARQMQALSFVVHIPLVAFGISFPAMVLFVEWLYLSTGDPLYGTLARRWTRVIVALFATGVITGTLLSFEMGLLWPNFTATFGSVFGLGSRSRASPSSWRRSSSGSTSTDGTASLRVPTWQAVSRLSSPASRGP